MVMYSPRHGRVSDTTISPPLVHMNVPRGQNKTQITKAKSPVSQQCEQLLAKLDPLTSGGPSVPTGRGQTDGVHNSRNPGELTVQTSPGRFSGYARRNQRRLSKNSQVGCKVPSPTLHSGGKLPFGGKSKKRVDSILVSDHNGVLVHRSANPTSHDGVVVHSLTPEQCSENFTQLREHFSTMSRSPPVDFPPDSMNDGAALAYPRYIPSSHFYESQTLRGGRVIHQVTGTARIAAAQYAASVNNNACSTSLRIPLNPNSLGPRGAQLAKVYQNYVIDKAAVMLIPTVTTFSSQAGSISFIGYDNNNDSTCTSHADKLISEVTSLGTFVAASAWTCPMIDCNFSNSLGRYSCVIGSDQLTAFQGHLVIGLIDAVGGASITNTRFAEVFVQFQASFFEPRVDLSLDFLTSSLLTLTWPINWVAGRGDPVHFVDVSPVGLLDATFSDAEAILVNNPAIGSLRAAFDTGGLQLYSWTHEDEQNLFIYDQLSVIWFRVFRVNVDLTGNVVTHIMFFYPDLASAESSSIINTDQTTASLCAFDATGCFRYAAPQGALSTLATLWQSHYILVN